MKRFTIHCYYPGMLSEDEKKELENRRGVLLGLCHAFDLYADTSGTETPLIKNSKEWFALQSAIKIRNRVTQPECPSDVNISDDDLSHLRATKKMFLALTSRCFLDSALALGHQADMLQRNWDRSNAPEKYVHRPRRRRSANRERLGSGKADYFLLQAASSSKYFSRLMRAVLMLDLMISTSMLVYVGIITGRAQPFLTYDL